MFPAHKDESFNVFFKCCKRVQNEKEVCITSIIDDHVGEFENEFFQLEENSILHNVSPPRTSQQNGVVERRNKSLQKMARIMLNDNYTPKHFWAKAMNIVCYLKNKN